MHADLVEATATSGGHRALWGASVIPAGAANTSRPAGASVVPHPERGFYIRAPVAWPTGPLSRQMRHGGVPGLAPSGTRPQRAWTMPDAATIAGWCFEFLVGSHKAVWPLRLA